MVALLIACRRGSDGVPAPEPVNRFSNEASRAGPVVARPGPCDSRPVLARRSSRPRFPAGVLGAVSSGPLHRAQISFAAMWAGESAFMVSLAVVAYGEGGVTAVGVVTAARM